ncbi:hypothetical protein LTS18_003562 [Coniosporium uncinatum]|uniref:Uncharacterized protein n=1 Tax=Coniosporium uncinatum TaxID=93489 RepID=A0ACC3DYE1_9PEZI|nr:hypothetical protein LTS18_003562 [Coniosporium uncinatum]
MNNTMARYSDLHVHWIESQEALAESHLRASNLQLEYHKLQSKRLSFISVEPKCETVMRKLYESMRYNVSLAEAIEMLQASETKSTEELARLQEKVEKLQDALQHQSTLGIKAQGDLKVSEETKKQLNNVLECLFRQASTGIKRKQGKLTDEYAPRVIVIEADESVADGSVGKDQPVLKRVVEYRGRFLS